MTHRFVMTPVHTNFLAQQMLQADKGTFNAINLNAATHHVMSQGEGSVCFAYVGSLTRAMALDTSSTGELYSRIIISDTPEFLYRLIFKTQLTKAQVDLRVDAGGENWRHMCNNRPNQGDIVGAEMMSATTFMQIVRDKAGHTLQHLPTFVKTEGWSSQDDMAEIMSHAEKVQRLYKGLPFKDEDPLW